MWPTVSQLSWSWPLNESETFLTLKRLHVTYVPFKINVDPDISRENYSYKLCTQTIIHTIQYTKTNPLNHWNQQPTHMTRSENYHTPVLMALLRTNSQTKTSKRTASTDKISQNTTISKENITCMSKNLYSLKSIQKSILLNMITSIKLHEDPHCFLEQSK